MTRRYSGPVFLSIGFRPFFIGSGAWAVFSMLAWIASLSGYITLPGHMGPAQWHSNELLFGVIGAAMIGFLLTAIPNWTGGLPLRGAPLLLSFGLWCAGRAAAMFGDYLGGPAAALIDCAFFVALFALILREILHGKNWRNLPVAVAVGLFAVAHILFYLEALETVNLGGVGQRLGLGVIAFMLTLIGGRIVPSFTANWLRQHASNNARAQDVAAVMGPVDKAVLLITVPALLAWIFAPEHPVTGIMLVIAGPANLLRLARWRGVYTYPEPLVFVLHVGYAWLAASFMLLGAAVLSDRVAQGDALHALTAGAAGTMILAVMSRAILGHTGNVLHADRVTAIAYCFVSVAALARLAVIALPEWGVELYSASGSAWILAFGLFVWRYGPISIRG
jgi:uncharacterized protein involved in response to NO